LFGILALQMDFISRDALIAAMNAWVLDKAKPLGQILLEQQALAVERHALLNALVQEHLKLHGNDPAKSLAAVSSVGSVRHDLAQIADPDLEHSLAHVSAARHQGADSWATQAGSVGAATSQGLRFRILRPHARGGLGEVFVAHDTELNREVALKEIQDRYADRPDSRARFLLEAEVTGRLEHPGIVPIYGLGTYADGRPFYAMRFIKGDSLQEAIERFHRPGAARQDPGQRSLQLRELLGRFVDVCNAIAYSHSRGVLHRDLKPGNVMLGQYGETLVVDWGLAKPLGKTAEAAGTGEGDLEPTSAGSATPTQMGQAIGTPAYMSPEQAAGRLGELGPASDVYSLGATLYCLLTGRPPFTDNEMDQVLRKVQRGDFLPPRQVSVAVPPALDAVCLKAMALRPADRYGSARLLAQDVERWLADEPVGAYREPLRLRLARWRRRHPALVTGSAALVLTALVAVSAGYVLLAQEQGRTLQAQNDRALAQVNALLEANPRAVPALLEGLEPFRAQVLPRLRELREGPDLQERHRARAALALLAVDPGQGGYLRERLLAEEVDPEEMLLLREALRLHREGLTVELWSEAERPGVKPERRFRALVALAGFDPSSPRWAAAGAHVVEPLLKADALHVATWAEALRPVRGALLDPLATVFRDRNRAAERRVAANLLREYAADRPDRLTDLLADADAQQFAVLLPKLREHGEAAVALLHQELERRPAPDWEEAQRDALARRQANAAAALLRLGQAERVWPLFRHSPDPRLRSYLLERLASLAVDGGLVARRLEEEPDVSARRALVLGLGEFTGDELPAEVRSRLVPRLLQWYQDDPDPGIHGAIDWLLRHGQEGPAPRKLDWGQAAALGKIDAGLQGQTPLAGRRWYVNGRGQTLAVIPGPVEFLMGSPAHEPGRFEVERLHRRRIGRSFALAMKPVTVAQFQEFLKAHPAVRHSYIKQISPEAEGPIIMVTWYEAAQYCRWLSEREGVPDEQMCYPPVAVIEKSKDGVAPLKLPPDYLARTGYRLPTEAEWEYACRAGAITSRYYGQDEALLHRYAWYVHNAQSRSWPVGWKRPNDFGLFDMHGNVWQWCQESAWNYPQAGNGRPAEDEEDKRDIVDPLSRVLRGGAFDCLPGNVRSALRIVNRPTDLLSHVGLRVARTYR
jgi:formylglycine-generating enzyme required for sulfatase activity/serine/threonine protein kinase